MAAKRKRKSSASYRNGSTKQKKNAEILGIIFFGISILLCIGVFFNKSTGLLGEMAGGLIYFLFGTTVGVVVPILMVAMSIAMLFRRGRVFIAHKGFPIFLFVILICAMFGAVTPMKDLKTVFAASWRGGIIGNFISWPLYLLLNTVGTYVVLSILLLIDFVIITGLSVLNGLKWFFKNAWLFLVSMAMKIRELFSDYKKRVEEEKAEGGKGGKDGTAGLPVDENGKKVKPLSPVEVINTEYQNDDDDVPTYKISGMGFENTPDVPPLTPLEEKQIIDSLNSSAHAKVPFVYAPPDFSLLTAPVNQLNPENERFIISEGSKKLEATLRSFGVEAKVINVTRGPAVTRYELAPAPGVKVSKIVNLADDIALNLASQGIRIEAPIPGKAAVGIEVPNKDMSAVYLVELLQSKEFQNFDSKLAFAVGKGLSGEIVVADIAKMPHLMIAGATGSGKSVCINSLIVSILYKASPEDVKLLMIDPKVVELGVYNGIPHLLIPVVTDPRKASGALNWAVQEMVQRYKLFAEKGVRDLKGYNAYVEQTKEGEKFPQIVIIIDELADLMMVAPNEVEDSICRLAQMARAAGMHLVIATQRPSVDVITGIIKANIPSRLSFAVASQVDSRTILDMGGAEKLLGKGDMLFHPSGLAKPVRIKGCMVTDTEVEKVVEYVKSQGECVYDDAIIHHVDADNGHGKDQSSEADDLLPKAIELIVTTGQASVSLLQRKFKVGYARAARMIDQMEERGIVGGFEGSKPRQILISKQQWQEMTMNSMMDEGDNE
ncbi:MAG: DNA translocase FtsK 4TM domain-containing protein [Clostridia bacterium]